MGYQFDFSVVWESWRMLLDGTLSTLYLTGVSAVLSLLLGVVLMLMRRQKKGVARVVAKVFIEVVRNTPFLVQLLFVFFGLPALGVKFSVEGAAIMALTINTGAYIAETLRAGVAALPKGQVEAGKALGMSSFNVFFDVVLKPSLRMVYPALSSQFVLMMLTTSVVVSISQAELTYTAQMIESSSFRSFEVYLVVTGIYLGLSLVVSLLLKAFGKFYFSYPVR
ncbi:amino acid ABC transporter permease [Pseudomonas putida]|uniref:amino acid ABC transporter permease n=1 Tax=Pseudomonas putida TaxID=303 RepID=UPI002363D3FC|nr:amino acid ABC transporter permease [Pseudomonas putida]MDD2002075.1 amino acid ABC transporter permease [Pseudomonas putida]